MARDRKNPHLDYDEFHGLLTTDPSMTHVFDTVTRVAAYDTPVLIRGESGTGKEGIAHAIHQNSPRKKKRFAAINCATLRPDLAASTLFGHARGAFTGAVSDRKGLFESTDEGTVFLDEIAELPLDVQAQLLRALQEGTFIPVGKEREISSDVRIVAATLQSLRNAVTEKRFREDLMYRVRVVVIYLPPLVERGRDLELLLWQTIDIMNQKMSRTVNSVTADGFETIRSYDWPGNVRELQNALEHAFVMSDGDVIDAVHLPLELRGEGPPDRRTTSDSEREEIRRALLEFSTRDEVASALGISRTTLWRKIREYGL